MDHLDWLRLGGVIVVVPEVVRDEVNAKGAEDRVARAIDQADWLTIASRRATPESVARCRLDPGESAVLSLAVGDPDSGVVLDDLAGRNCARRLGIPCLGTLGVILLAKRLGVIPAARPVFDQLRRVGLYLDDGFVEAVLERVGEPHQAPPT